MARKGTLTVRVIGDTKPLGKSLKGIGGMAAGAVGTIAKVGAAAAAAGAVAAATFGVKAVKAASDLNETLSKSNTIFKDNAGEIEKWANGAATGFGQSKTQALEAASTFGNMFDQLGIGSDQAASMSTSMVELASDFASFHNADVTQVLEAQTAAFRGEYDAVQRFVPTINAAAVQQKALEMGLAGSTGELTAQHKALATQQLLMEGAGEAAGDFDRTSGSLANQTRTLQSHFADFTADLGTKLLPIAEKVASWAGRVMPKVFGAAQVAVDRLLGVVAAFGDWWAVHGPAIVATATAIGETISTTVAAALRWLGEWWATNGPTVIATAQAIWEALQTIADTVVTVVATIIEHWGTIGPVIAVVAGLITAVFIPHWVALGVAAIVNSAKNAVAWVTTQASAIKAAVVHSAEVVKMVARWVFLGAQSLVHAAKVVAGWAMTGAAALKNVAVHIAQVAVMVAKWVFLGAQSLLHAGKVALAWLIAMGPIALVVAAVVGLVVLIVRNWDTIVAKTRALWEKVKEIFGRLKDSVVEKVRAAGDWVKARWEALRESVVAATQRIKDGIVEKFNAAVDWVRGIPRRIVSALGSLGGLLKNAGREIIGGLLDGIKAKWESVKSYLSSLGGKIRDLKGPIEKDKVLLVAEGAAIMAGLGAGIGRGWTRVRKQLTAITSDIPTVAASGARRVAQASGMLAAATIPGGGMAMGPARSPAGGSQGRGQAGVTLVVKDGSSGASGLPRMFVQALRDGLIQLEMEQA